LYESERLQIQTEMEVDLLLRGTGVNLKILNENPINNYIFV